MKGFKVTAALWVVSLAFSAPVLAHHSVQSVFDIHKTITVTGTIAKVEWINPHSYITVNAKDANGNVQKWGFELGAQAALRRSGLSRADRGGIKPGDEVTIIAQPARDGSTNGIMREMKMGDGRDFKFNYDPNGNVADGSN
jgi:hypothetical protein